ncbi:type IV pilus assembly protein PilM [Candidatus Uhrbacteria bacterium]|nr:type IV pilus assembly protein PilM [Candidatus Uhrbacteria bacterium]
MSFRKELSFGLDIGDRSLKALQFVKSRNIISIAGFAEVALPPNVIENGDLKNAAQLSAALHTLVRKAGIVAERAVLALPERKTFLKLITFAPNAKLPLRLQLEQELARHLPYEIQEVFWDSYIVNNVNGVLTVLAGAAPKNIVKDYTNCIQNANLIPVLLDVEPLSIARAAISNTAPESCTLVVDLGGTKSTLIIANANTVFYTTDARASGEDLTEDITQKLKIEKKAAEELKIKYGINPTKKAPAEYSKLVERYAKDLSDRIQQFINFSLSRESLCRGISLILLSGGGALLDGLSTYLGNALKIPVRLASPWAHINEFAVKAIDAQTGLRFTTATGLALKAMEFDHTI